MDESLTRLKQEAAARRAGAHAPYSEFLVGAAVQASDGRIFGGCNIENASFGLSICAQRVALFNAITAGARNFERLLIVATPWAAPCGSCRQVMSEFFGDDTEIWSIDAANSLNLRHWTMGELLPDRFRLK